MSANFAEYHTEVSSIPWNFSLGSPFFFLLPLHTHKEKNIHKTPSVTSVDVSYFNPAKHTTHHSDAPGCTSISDLLTNNTIDDTKDDGKEDEVPLPLESVNNSRKAQKHKHDSLADIGHHLHGVFNSCDWLLWHVGFRIMPHCDPAKSQTGKQRIIFQDIEMLF